MEDTVDHRDMKDFATRVTFARAWNTHAPEGERICNDTLAHHFLSQEHRQAALTPEGRAHINTTWTPLESALIAHVAVRTRVMDEFFRNAVQEGVEQIVLLGAGYDSRAYRLMQPESKVVVFELDRPFMIETKTQAVCEFTGRLPEHVVYVGLDFTRQDILAELLRHGFSSEARTACIWEGVSFFLDQSTVERVLGFLSRCGGPGSRAAFDYVSDCVPKHNCDDDFAEIFTVYLREMGEPYRFGVRPDALDDFLSPHGLQTTTNRSVPQWRDYYAPDGSCSLKPPSFFHIAQAKIRDRKGGEQG